MVKTILLATMMAMLLSTPGFAAHGGAGGGAAVYTPQFRVVGPDGNEGPSREFFLICLAGNTLIETPHGPIAVRDLRVGAVVWTADADGYRREAPILKTARIPVPIDHEMIELILDDGREVTASPGHPTADGRVIGNLRRGDSLDSRYVVSDRRIRSAEQYTYDILPAGETGVYWANGIPMGSTLFTGRRRIPSSESSPAAEVVMVAANR